MCNYYFLTNSLLSVTNIQFLTYKEIKILTSQTFVFTLQDFLKNTAWKSTF
jgi:hypothetical protein